VTQSANQSKKDPSVLSIWIHYARCFAGYTVYLFSHLFLFILIIPLTIILSPFKKLSGSFLTHIFNGYVHFLCRIYLPAMGIYRFRELSGLTRIKDNQPAIYIANHRSRLDGPIILSWLKNTGVLIKAKYAETIFFKGLVTHYHFITVDTSSLSSLSTALGRAEKLLKQGINILIFPEGTRATNARLLPFRDFAFRLSRSSKRPVIPVLIHTDTPVLTKSLHSIIQKKCVDIRLRILEPSYIEQREKPAEFADRIRKIMSEELQLLDKGTEWEEL